ncbi:MAG: nitrate reductase subunit beta [Bacteroidaceae bacterium]|nr:nitrate reductase subunit beta [Bacteroidaceae bacterium]
MKIKAQITMVLNLDKCIGCHTCSVSCKNVWTSRKGLEYAWFNNVETKPGPGYPKRWEDQEKFKGGWKLDKERLGLRLGNRLKIMSQIFSNPYLPQVEDYYEPFTFDFSSLKGKKRVKTPPSARPYSLITGEKMKKIENGPNWEDDLAGTFDQRKTDPNLQGLDICGFEEFEKSFMFYVPRLCEHCLNPACAASCPSGAIYKRKEDGIVVINQDRCRGWRECVSACPYKKIYFNYERMKSEKCIFCYPRIEDGQPTVCSETCVGRMRYMGVILYDADKINDYAAANEQELYKKQLDLILDPHDPEIIREAEEQGISHNYIMAAQQSPTYKLMKEWQIAFPLHPEYHTLPMVWYVPPMSPKKSMTTTAEGESFFAQVEEMRIPSEYLAKLLTAGDTQPIKTALAKLLALREYMRLKTVEGETEPQLKENFGLNAFQYDDMYNLLAIADFKDRFVIPSSPKQKGKHHFDERTGLGFEGETTKKNLWGGK